MLIVDTTSVRIGSSDLKAYSGHKHHRCAKVQVVATANGSIVDVSDSYPGSVHDKRIWDAEALRLPLNDAVVLGHKAYAGGHGEGVTLFRPTKRNESDYRDDKYAAKQRNRQISRIRLRIEHVFARLKCWRVIAGLFPYHWSKLGVIVKALAVLHNLARDYETAFIYRAKKTTSRRTWRNVLGTF
nr:transposase family protein [uncultured Cupriavidus sp.]